MNPTNRASVPWDGLNHLALITNDMDATVRFWHGVMGAPLIATIGTDTFRHYFSGSGPRARLRSSSTSVVTPTRSPSRPACSTPGPGSSTICR